MRSLLGIVVLLLVQSACGQTGSGIIGFGISLYEDLCCQACHDSLSSLFLTCTAFSNETGANTMPSMGGMAGMPEMGTATGTTSPECYASNTPWLQTMAYCIQQKCNAHGYPADKQTECFKRQAVNGASSPSLRDSLPIVAPVIELAANAMWLNVTSLVNKDTYFSNYGTAGEFARSEYLHTKYSVALYILVIGTCVIGGLLAQLAVVFPSILKKLQERSIWPKLRQHVFLPSLIGSRRLEPLPGQTGYMPRRTVSVFIVVYVILNVIFSAVGYGSFQPNVNFKSKGFELCEYVGNRTGTLSLVNASIAILFAGRNNLLIAWTGWSQTTFITLHRWTARVATLQALVHSIVYTLAYWQPGYSGASAYAAKAMEPFYWWGIIATMCFCLATGFSILPIRISFYETFLALHVILAVLALVACWYHLVPHFGYAFGYQTWLYICFAYWGFERVSRVARVAFYNRLGGSKAVVEAIPNSKVMQLTVYPDVAWEFGPGQHTFLYIPGMGKFWENHPFSIAGWKGGKRTATSVFDEDTRPGSKDANKEYSAVTVVRSTAAEDEERASIIFLIQAHGGATERLRRRLVWSPSPSVELPVYTEGPYAGHRARLQPLCEAETVLCIVGGIGITGVLGLIQQYANMARTDGESVARSRGVLCKTRRFILAWSSRDSSVIDHVRWRFLDDAPGFECAFWCTEGIGSETAPKDDRGYEGYATTTGIHLGRMNIGVVIKSCLDRNSRTTVMVCGPGRMADEATKYVVNCVRDGFPVDLIEESFAW
ncbi:ferric-chelate reductase [Colletotrichum musicola]|uniref:Ferric-chelate reductase n=1 Tax=Colletotrichum musicola TaxID=2175873 RepID=A0A8H6NGV4_9PEZI|nr:ferric-chelate reductase [Colletotrichum musicola]